MPTPAIVAHRGIHHEQPENSLEALLAAWNAGGEWCECDIRGSAEHEPFLLHDGTLERTTDGTGLIENVATDVLKSAGNCVATTATISSCHVPLLQTVIRAMPAGAKFLIEIKPKVHRDVVCKTLDLCDPATCVIQSFDADVLHQAFTHRREIKRMYLTDDIQNPIAQGRGPWSQVNARFNSLNLTTVQMIRARGLGIGAWTPNEEADIERMLDLNLDMIISDEPQRVARLAKSRKFG